MKTCDNAFQASINGITDEYPCGAQATVIATLPADQHHPTPITAHLCGSCGREALDLDAGVEVEPITAPAKTWTQTTRGHELRVDGRLVATITWTANGWVGRWDGDTYAGSWGALATAKREIDTEFDRLAAVYS